MRITVCSGRVRLWLPIPLSLADAAVSLIPNSAIIEMKKSVPPCYQGFVTRQNLRFIIRECRSTLKEYKGLEMIHVKSQDGTFVSLRL